jgi:hypothetical protein
MEVRDCIATQKAFEEYLDWTDEFTQADLEFALGNLGNRIVRQEVETPEEMKATLIDKICELIASSNGGRDGKHNEHSVKTERSKMAHWTISELTQRLETISEKQRLQKLSAGEIRQELQASRSQPQVKVLPTEFTRERIHGMPPYEIRRLIRDYTAAVVNNRLFGRD